MSVFNKQPFYTAYIKYFNSAGTTLPFIPWIYSVVSNAQILTPSNPSVNVVIPNDLTVGGTIYGHVVPVCDQRLKEGIMDLDPGVKTKMLSLKPREYIMKNDIHKRRNYGFIAQEVESVFPNWVETMQLDGEPTKAVRYTEMIPALLACIQDLQKEVDALREEVKKKC